jgi:hypothetical protein
VSNFGPAQDSWKEGEHVLIKGKTSRSEMVD